MSNRNLEVYLDDILESIRQIEKYLDKISKRNFIKIQKSKMPFYEDWKLLEKR